MKLAIHDIRMLLEKALTEEFKEVHLSVEQFKVMVKKNTELLTELQQTALMKDVFEDKMHILEREVRWNKNSNEKTDFRCADLETYLSVYSPVQ